MAARLTTYVVVGIVAATLIAGLIVGAQRDDNDGPVDLIVFNAKVYTADAPATMAEAVAVRGNQILRVGSNREINRLRRPQTRSSMRRAPPCCRDSTTPSAFHRRRAGARSASTSLDAADARRNPTPHPGVG